ncbi:MAG: hypothetical protein N2645_15440 [Clostridia bacterium]|nr:hypothetical protein [Clostridia bacterium]
MQNENIYILFCHYEKLLIDTINPIMYKSKKKASMYDILTNFSTLITIISIAVTIVGIVVTIPGIITATHNIMIFNYLQRFIRDLITLFGKYLFLVLPISSCLLSICSTIYFSRCANKIKRSFEVEKLKKSYYQETLLSNFIIHKIREGIDYDSFLELNLNDLKDVYKYFANNSVAVRFNTVDLNDFVFTTIKNIVPIDFRYDISYYLTEVISIKANFNKIISEIRSIDFSTKHYKFTIYKDNVMNIFRI